MALNTKEKARGKSTYLSSNLISKAIEKGLVDEYDIIITKDTHEQYYVGENMVVFPIKSRNDNYASEEAALSALRSKTDSYAGQIVNVLHEGKYIPYIVNKDENNEFYIQSVSTINDDYNYDHFYNKPIENIVADTEIVLTDLGDGFYTLIGNYRICDNDQTHRITTGKIYLVIESVTDSNNNTFTHIAEIKGSRIAKYICSDNGFTEDRYILQSEIENNVDDVLDREFESRVDDYVTAHEASDQDIQDLFSD